MILEFPYEKYIDAINRKPHINVELPTGKNIGFNVAPSTIKYRTQPPKTA